MRKVEKEGIITYKDMDAFEIQKFQQNRYPLLFIDYVEDTIWAFELGIFSFFYSYC